MNTIKFRPLEGARVGFDIFIYDGAQERGANSFSGGEKTQATLNVKGGELLLDAFENILINGAVHNDSETIQLWIKVSEVQEEEEKF